MTAVTPGPAAALTGRRRGVGAAAIVVLGSAALLARPAAIRLLGHPVGLLVALFLALGLVGLLWPLDGDADALASPGPAASRTTTPVVPAAALALGLAAFATGRLLGGVGTVALGGPVTPLLLNALAAVAEEAFFRRLLYGLLAPRGTTVAILGSALCFAAVHVPIWGVGVLPLDLAAGLLLGWQRAATGRWQVPAVTHVAANLLAAL